MYFRILPHSVQIPFSRFLTDLFLVLWLAINFVGTPACCVRRVSSEFCHKQISRISRNKRSICEIGEICVREISSDAARNVSLLPLFNRRLIIQPKRNGLVCGEVCGNGLFHLAGGCPFGSAQEKGLKTDTLHGGIVFGSGTTMS